MPTPWDTVIGLEVHVQLNTQSKLFSTSPTAYGAEPNAQVSPVDAGLPGALPVPNQAALRMAIAFGLAVGATIPEKTVFSRKNYFYPDLPKGYQISQDSRPITLGGHVTYLNGDTLVDVPLVRAHLEEDAGKSTHDPAHGVSRIDLNRAGMPLLEVVSEPALHSPDDAVAYLKALRLLVRTLGISTGNMQEGAFRCDANVSVRPSPDAPLGTRVEIKNINSFRFVERAIQYEVERQTHVLSSGGTVVQETRLFHEATQTTQSMRSKENAEDYRYFPDPDLPVILVSNESIESVRATLPELPLARAQRYIDALGLSAYDANVLVADPDLARYFEDVLASAQAPAKTVANWLTGDVMGWMNKQGRSMDTMPIQPERMAAFITRVNDGTLSGPSAKQLLSLLFTHTDTVDTLIEHYNLAQISDPDALQPLVDAVVNEHPQQFAAYQSGKTQLFGFFVGQVMKRSQGKANPQHVRDLLQARLGSPNETTS